MVQCDCGAFLGFFHESGLDLPTMETMRAVKHRLRAVPVTLTMTTTLKMVGKTRMLLLAMETGRPAYYE